MLSRCEKCIANAVPSKFAKVWMKRHLQCISHRRLLINNKWNEITHFIRLIMKLLTSVKRHPRPHFCDRGQRRTEEELSILGSKICYCFISSVVTVVYVLFRTTFVLRAHQLCVWLLHQVLAPCFQIIQHLTRKKAMIIKISKWGGWSCNKYDMMINSL